LISLHVDGCERFLEDRRFWPSFNGGRNGPFRDHSIFTQIEPASWMQTLLDQLRPKELNWNGCATARRNRPCVFEKQSAFETLAFIFEDAA